MSDADIDLLEQVMVDFAAHEPAEHVAALVQRLLVDPPAALQCCLGVLVATVRVAREAGLVPAPSGDAFFGLTIVETEPGALADADSTDRARHTALQALTAVFNDDTQTAAALLAGPLSIGYPEGVAAFHQCLVVWRSVVSTQGGATAVQLLDPDGPKS